MLTLTSPIETVYHKQQAGLKLGLLALFTFVLFYLEALPAILGAAAVLVALHLAAGLRFSWHAVKLIWPLWPFVAALLILYLWQDRLSQGAVILVRMICAVAAANLVTMTTKLSDLLTVLEKVFYPLSFLIAPKKLALSVALLLRFVPRFRDILAQLRDAYRARSTKRIGWRILLPALLSALDDAEHTAEALRARGGV